MKKYFLYFIICIATAAIFSCTKESAPADEIPAEEPAVVETNKVPMVFSAVIEETKSDISGKNILWESTDKIAIFDGTSLNEFSVSSVSADGKGADFSGTAASAAEYHAFAPFSTASSLKTENSRISVTVHGTQTIIGSHCVDPESLVSTAVSAGTSDLSFTNQFSLMKITLARDDVTSVTVFGNNNESIAGTNHYYYAGEGAPKMDYTNAGGKKVTLQYKATASSSTSAFPAGDYYIAIWPTDFTAGYTVLLTNEDGGKSLKSTSAEQNLLRNAGQNLETIDDATFCPAIITTAAQLKMWRRLANVDAYAAGEEVKLGADINLGGYAWTPVPSFKGIFNGQNHKIYNFTISSDAANVGFIGQLGTSNAEEAVLKDVVFGSSNGTSYDGSSSITVTGARSDWTYGGIVGYAQKKTTISGVTNFMPVSAASSVTGKHAIGGISGSGNGGDGNGITITGCNNYGAITDNSASAVAENSAIGGILGATDGSNTMVSSCVNHGEVHNYCVGVSRLGGIVGKAWDAKVTISECTNEGNIINEASSVTDKTSSWDNSVGVGGILGAFTAKNGGALIYKCSNSGTFKMAASPNESYRNTYGGIVGNITYGCTVKGCTNTGNYTETVSCASLLTVGGIVGLANTSSFILTKADDDTYNTNSGELWHLMGHDESYYGGIVGLANSSNYIEYCINNGRIISDPTGQSYAKFHGGGICGAAVKIIRNCTNNGYVFTYAGKLTSIIGGICGGEKTPSQVVDCVNNGYLSPFNAANSGSGSYKGSSVCGGILAILSPNTTTVRSCTNTGMITTGDFYRNGSGNNPGTLRSFQGKDYYMGGLFGYVNAPTADVTNATDCIVACTFGQKTGSSGKDNYKGIIAGEAKSTSSTGYKVEFGSVSNPILIVNTTNFQYGTDANPAVITQGDIITTTALANKWLMGSVSALYDATNGTSDASKVDFNYVIATAAQAGID